MKSNVLFLLACAAILGCRKHDVDIASLNTSRFDPDWVGPSFMRIDSIRTVPYASGALHRQQIHLHLDEELRNVQDYVIRVIEYTVPDTTIYPAVDPAQPTVVILNYLVQLGEEYCYDIDLRIGSGILLNHRLSPCDVAEL